MEASDARGAEGAWDAIAAAIKSNVAAGPTAVTPVVVLPYCGGGGFASHVRQQVKQCLHNGGRGKEMTQDTVTVFQRPSGNVVISLAPALFPGAAEAAGVTATASCDVLDAAMNSAALAAQVGSTVVLCLDTQEQLYQPALKRVLHGLAASRARMAGSVAPTFVSCLPRLVVVVNTHTATPPLAADGSATSHRWASSRVFDGPAEDWAERWDEEWGAVVAAHAEADGDNLGVDARDGFARGTCLVFHDFVEGADEGPVAAAAPSPPLRAPAHFRALESTRRLKRALAAGAPLRLSINSGFMAASKYAEHVAGAKAALWASKTVAGQNVADTLAQLESDYMAATLTAARCALLRIDGGGAPLELPPVHDKSPDAMKAYTTFSEAEVHAAFEATLNTLPAGDVRSIGEGARFTSAESLLLSVHGLYTADGGVQDVYLKATEKLDGDERARFDAALNDMVVSLTQELLVFNARRMEDAVKAFAAAEGPLAGGFHRRSEVLNFVANSATFALHRKEASYLDPDTTRTDNELKLVANELAVRNRGATDVKLATEPFARGDRGAKVMSARCDANKVFTALKTMLATAPTLRGIDSHVSPMGERYKNVSWSFPEMGNLGENFEKLDGIWNGPNSDAMGIFGWGASMAGSVIRKLDVYWEGDKVRWMCWTTSSGAPFPVGQYDGDGYQCDSYTFEIDETLQEVKLLVRDYGNYGQVVAGIHLKTSRTDSVKLGRPEPDAHTAVRTFADEVRGARLCGFRVCGAWKDNRTMISRLRLVIAKPAPLVVEGNK